MKNYGAIEHFIVFDELRSIARKIGKTDYVPLSKVIYAKRIVSFHRNDAQRELKRGVSAK